METAAKLPFEAVSFLENLEDGIIGVDSELVCSFANVTCKDFLSSYKKFAEMLSVTKKLKRLNISLSGGMISDELGNALADNDSLETIKTRNYYFANDIPLINFLPCLERNTSLTDISFEECRFDDEEVDFILNSSNLRRRLVSVGTLKTNKQIHTLLYRCSRLTELSIDFAFKVKPFFVLRNLCFFKQLKKLYIQTLQVSDLFLAFPKWTNELKNLFPLTNSLYLKSPFTSLLNNMLSSNVANYIDIDDTSFVNSTNIRSFLAAAESKARKVNIQDRRRPGSDTLVGDTIRFAARLRSKDADWVHYSYSAVSWSHISV